MISLSLLRHELGHVAVAVHCGRACTIEPVRDAGLITLWDDDPARPTRRAEQLAQCVAGALAEIVLAPVGGGFRVLFDKCTTGRSVFGVLEASPHAAHDLRDLRAMRPGAAELAAATTTATVALRECHDAGCLEAATIALMHRALNECGGLEFEPLARGTLQ